jgi:dUTP pyrophosphatase
MKFISSPITYTSVMDDSPGWSRPDAPTLKFFKINEEAFDPIWGTLHAACFDLAACLIETQLVKAFRPDNTSYEILVNGALQIEPGHRVMVPTGLKFDIPTGYSVRIHSRSGLAVKQGLVLANHEGVIDSDYVDPTYVVLTNTSTVTATVLHGDRIGQGEMVPDMAYEVNETFDEPKPKSDRKGGFGSSGVQHPEFQK